MLNKAIAIANKAHANQQDKAGKPYILHPLRVMLSLSSEAEMICGVMHDVVEDSDITFNDLIKEGFSDEIIKVLDCITKKENESYDEFIDRILLSSTACRIKLADLNDNMNLSRIDNPTEKDFERILKYEAAKRRIEEAMLRNNNKNQLL